ncbi:hypothetical protein BJX70DRAFT_79706 [Aspergillus crustosus]
MTWPSSGTSYAVASCNVKRYLNSAFRSCYESPWRPEASQRPWFGNTVRDINAFDHKVFKKSPREAMAQDSQQRLILHVAYQALESAGYFPYFLFSGTMIHCVRSRYIFCPVSLLLVYAVELLASVPEGQSKIHVVGNVGSDAPLLLDPDREVWIELGTTHIESTWSLKFSSKGKGAESVAPLIHCTAEISMHN